MFRSGEFPWMRILCIGLWLVIPGCEDDSSPASTGDVREDGEDATADLREDEHQEVGAEEPPIEVEDPLWMQWLEPGPYGHQRETRTWVDTSRAVMLAGSEDPMDRTLQVTIWSPETPPGPGPLVIWAHGMGSEREDSTATARLLASRGFVVAAPDFPKTTRRGGRAPDVMDVVEQPVDVLFLLDQILAANTNESDSLFGLVDPSRIGAGGISLGAMTVLLASWHAPWRDERLRSIVALTPPACFLPRPVIEGDGPATVIVLGDADAIVDYPTSEAALLESPDAGATYLRFHGGTHTAFADRVGNLLDGLDHIDVIGCNSVENDLPLDALGQLSESLGGLSSEEMAAACLSPCTNDALSLPTMPPSRQVRLTRALVVGSFEATLGARDVSLESVADALLEEDDVSPILP